ncbi:neutral zinc metallopeptidase [Kribbella sp. NPDC056951]|uniref:neutral zinc metallopeptidase n=1 Tax=Kribbella sp. NPDC056951 TaxID=3345978 RepID=UPI0036284252
MSGNQQWGPPPPPQGYYAPPPQQPQYYGPPPGAPQYGWGPMPPQQKPPRKRGLAFLVFGLLAVIAAGGVLIAVKIVQNGNEDVATNTPAGPTRWTPPQRTTPSMPVATTTRPTTAPTATKTTPRPLSQTDPLKYVATHRLYKSGPMRSVNCKESKGGMRTLSQTATYYKTLMNCLNRAWPRQVSASGARFEAPRLIVFNTQVQSPCGNSDRGLSFYCSSSHGVYMRASNEVANWKTNPGFTRALATHTVAHEYAHAMQESTGLMSAYERVRYNQPTSARRLEMNRRMELQASCLANVFLGANRNSYPLKGESYRNWLYIVNNSGDVDPRFPADHGTPGSHGYWSRGGFAAHNPSKCNTFSAGPAKVR